MIPTEGAHQELARLHEKNEADKNSLTVTNEIQFSLADEWAVHKNADTQQGILDWIDAYSGRFRKLIDEQPGILTKYVSGHVDEKRKILTSLKEKLYH